MDFRALSHSQDSLKRVTANETSKVCKLTVAILFSALLSWTHGALADDDDDEGEALMQLNLAHTYDLSRDEFDTRLTPLDFNLVGDSIDIVSGAISFNVTDVVLLGNSELEVAFRRKASEAQSSHNPRQSDRRAYQPLADWVLDVPSLSTFRYRNGNEQMGGVSNSGCFLNRDILLDESVHIPDKSAYISSLALSGGLMLSLPGKGSEQIVNTVLVTTSGDRWGSFENSEYQGASKKYSTLHCKGSYSEVTTKDGTIYSATKKVLIPATSIYSRTSGSAASEFNRYKEIHLITQAQDIHGNTVNWDYDSLGRLTQISSNDGRVIDVNYNGNSRHVSTVLANGRIWQYNYTTVSYSGHNYESSGQTTVLSSVTQPDGNSWSYNIGNLTNTPVRNQAWMNSRTISVTHPYGTHVEFELKSKTQNITPFLTTDYAGYFFLVYQRNLSLMRKTVTGPGLPTSEWTYTYEEPIDDHLGYADFGDDLKRITKTAPDGGFTEYFASAPYRTSARTGLEGSNQHIKMENRYSSENGVLLQKIDNEYILSTPFGEVGPDTYTSASLEHYLTKKTLTLNGDIYTTEYEYEIDPQQADYSYGLPLRIKRYSNLPNAIQRNFSQYYKHDKTKWILGLKTTSYLNAKLYYEYDYDSYGRLTGVDSFGADTVDYTYYTSGDQKGLVSTATDSLGRITKYSNYRRGIPEKVTRALGTSDEVTTLRIVDDNGWVMSVTDGLGRKDEVQRDNMGRITVIDPYGDWYNTDISYNFPLSGGVTQTIELDQQITTITYDGLLRTILEKQEDTATNWYAYVNTEFDAAGRKSFTSYPSTTATHSQGTAFEYDVLGRIKRETQYPSIITEYNYLTDNAAMVTDPDGYLTTTQKSGYGSPRDGDVLLISSPESVNTKMTYDGYGNLTTLRQFGSQDGYNVDETQKYFYDARNRLCRHEVDELSAKLMAYDDANQLTSYSEGQSTGTSCTTPSSGKVSLTYDNLDRLKLTDFSDNTPDIARIYDKNGNITQISRGIAVWDYQYFDNDMLSAESLNIDGLNFNTGYERDNYGHVSAIIYPSGDKIYQAPDAFGRPTSLIASDTTGGNIYVDSVKYHLNQSLKSFSYGNSVQFNQELNSRLLPENIETWRGSGGSLVDILDYGYSYDVRGNTTHIDDGVDSSRNIINTYDGLSRLETSNSSYVGNITFKYDAVGNLRKRTITSGTSLGGAQHNATMNYNAKNQISSVVTSAGTRSFAHDNKGNVTSNGIYRFTYDLANQPKTTGSNTFVYDGNLKRVKKIVNGESTYFVYTQGAGLVSQYNKSSGKHTDLVRLVKQMVARVESAGSIADSSTVPFNDTIDSLPSGGLTGRDFNLPFGKSIANANNSDSATGFTGHVKDSTGLTYMQARYYDPEIGRFYSNDPVGFRDVHSFNRYSYVANNPYKYTDPSGMTLECSSDEHCTTTQSLEDIEKEEANRIRLERIESERLYNEYRNKTNTTNSSLGYGASIASRVIVNGDGVWLGKNGKYYSSKWGGNGSTGGRSFATSRVNALKVFGRVSFVTSAGLSIYNYNTPNGPSGMKTSIDIGMAALGFVWPIGTAASAAYFMVDLSNGGNWSGH